MALDKAIIEKLAKHCEDAELYAKEITKITDDYPEMTYEDAYDIQWTARRAKEARGHKIVGMKMGLTSQAKMKQMGVPNPCYGYLADYFAYGDGAEIKIDEL
ncbi:MAG: 4-oxalocrotonate decarboxylase, partial [Aliarcobacter sp.]|nr:4-oxalocrotonate decarboxylase [Aliarcobacter sp.]